MPPKDISPMYVMDEKGRFYELGKVEIVQPDKADRMYELLMESNNHRRMRGERPLRIRAILRA